MCMKKYVLPLIVALFIAAPASLTAQTWEPLGPFGPRTVMKVAESDSALVMLCYVPAGMRLFRSEDNGKSWEESVFPYNKVQADISNVECLGNVFYAATHHSDVCMSTDHGRTWIVRNDIHDGQMRFDVASILDINGALYIGWGDKYYNSNDSGLTYFFAKARVDGNMIKSAIINDNIVDNIVTVTKSGVYISNDRAGSWKTITPPFVEDDYDGRDLAVLGNTIYVSTYRRVYYSTDLGTSWKVSEPFTLGDTYIRIASYASRIWIASDSSLFYTSDNFASVHTAAKPPDHRFTWTLTSVSSALFISAIDGGGYISHDSAKTWMFLEEGFPARAMNNVWANDNILMAGTATGLLMRSTNYGMSWQRSFQSSTIASGSNQFSAMFALGDSIFVTTDEDHQIVRTGNDGISWTTDKKSAPWYEVHDIAGREGLWVAVVKRDGSVYRSTDRGNSWAVVKGSYASDNFRMLVLHDTSFFAASPRGGIWRSNADATKFEKLVGVGLPEGTCYSVASNGKTLFAGSYRSLFRSLDNGASWQEIDVPLTGEVYDIKCHGSNIVILERTSVNNMVYYSPDECDTIITLSPDGFTSRDSWEAAINNKYLFIQSKDKGIFRYNYLPLKSVKNDVSQSSFTVHPNPAQRVVNIEARDKANATVHLIDMLGREVRTGRLSEEGTLTLEVSDLANGIYTIMLEHNGAKSFEGKVVVEK
jgi:photosystem II stability/assembly factor-like uncharacterized protein